MVTEEEILKISKIARILITEDEVKIFAKKINDVLKFVDMINEIDFKDEVCNN